MMARRWCYYAQSFGDIVHTKVRRICKQHRAGLGGGVGAGAQQRSFPRPAQPSSPRVRVPTMASPVSYLY